MSNNRVNRKVLGAPSNTTGPIGWVQLAEDAERDAEKACSRSKQLTEAATIFRENAEKDVPFPVGA